VWHAAALDVEAGEVGLADSVLLAFTGGSEGTDSHVVARHHLGPLFVCLNSLLDALGLAQVEVAAAALAALQGGVSARCALSTIRDADDALVRMARRLVRVGRSIEALIGTADTDAITALSWEAVAVREGVDLARRSAIAELATQVACVTLPRESDERLSNVERSFADGDVRKALGVGDEGLSPGVALRSGRPALAAQELSKSSFSPTSIALSLRIALGLLAGEPVEALGERLYVDAEQQRSAFALVESAIALSCCADRDRFEPLRRAASVLRRQKRGDALNLLVARWGELLRGAETVYGEADE
jgi:hypothetical protein